MYVHLPGRYYDVNLFHLKAFVSVLRIKSSKFVHISFFFLGRFQTIWSCQFNFTRLFILFRVILRQVVSGLPVRFFSVNRSFQEDLSTFLARVSGNAFSSEFKFLDARNLTFLQPLPNTLYKLFKFKTRQFFVSLNTEAK